MFDIMLAIALVYPFWLSHPDPNSKTRILKISLFKSYKIMGFLKHTGWILAVKEITKKMLSTTIKLILGLSKCIFQLVPLARTKPIISHFILEVYDCWEKTLKKRKWLNLIFFSYKNRLEQEFYKISLTPNVKYTLFSFLFFFGFYNVASILFFNCSFHYKLQFSYWIHFSVTSWGKYRKSIQ